MAYYASAEATGVTPCPRDCTSRLTHDDPSGRFSLIPWDAADATVDGGDRTISSLLDSRRAFIDENAQYDFGSFFEFADTRTSMGHLMRRYVANGREPSGAVSNVFGNNVLSEYWIWLLDDSPYTNQTRDGLITRNISARGLSHYRTTATTGGGRWIGTYRIAHDRGARVQIDLLSASANTGFDISCVGSADNQPDDTVSYRGTNRSDNRFERQTGNPSAPATRRLQTGDCEQSWLTVYQQWPGSNVERDITFEYGRPTSS